MAINYLAFRFWIGMWVCLILLLMVAFDLSALVRYITRFTEESFAMLIALIFIYEAFKKLIHILDKSPVDLHPDLPQDFNCSCFPPPIDPDNSSSAASFLSTTLSSVTGKQFTWRQRALMNSSVSDSLPLARFRHSVVPLLLMLRFLFQFAISIHRFQVKNRCTFLCFLSTPEVSNYLA